MTTWSLSYADVGNGINSLKGRGVLEKNAVL